VQSHAAAGLPRRGPPPRGPRPRAGGGGARRSTRETGRRSPLERPGDQVLKRIEVRARRLVVLIDTMVTMFAAGVAQRHPGCGHGRFLTMLNTCASEVCSRLSDGTPDKVPGDDVQGFASTPRTMTPRRARGGEHVRPPLCLTRPACSCRWGWTSGHACPLVRMPAACNAISADASSVSRLAETEPLTASRTSRSA
jgi:hypothetical protein